MIAKKIFPRLLVVVALGVCISPVVAVEIDWLGGDGAWGDGANWPGGILPTNEDFVTLPNGVTITSSGESNIAEEMITRAKLRITDGLFTVVGTIDAFDEFIISPSSEVSAGRIFMQAAGLLDLQMDAIVNVTEGVFSSGKVDVRDGAVMNAESFDNFNQWDVRAGGSVIANSMINHTGATVDVFQASSVFDINGNLTNNGNLNIKTGASAQIDSIENNATVEASGASQLVGNSVNNNGLLSIAGTGSNWQADIVTNFSGIVSVTDKATSALGTVDNRGAIDVDDATLSVNDGVNTATGMVSLTNEAELAVVNLLSNFGQVTIDESSQLLSNTFQQLDGETMVAGGSIGANGSASTTISGGTLIGNGAISGDLSIINAGLLTPDGGPSDPTAQFSVSDNLLLGASFNVDLGGTATNDFDRIVVMGDADLGGVLNVDLVAGFAPLLGDFFDIIVAENVVGDFDSLFLPVLSNGLALEGINGGSFYRLQIVAAPVPIPVIMPLFVAALIGLSARRKAIN